MIKIYSKSCEHILRILGQIPQKDCKRIFLAKDICRKAKVPEYSARKGLQLLVQQGILKAIPGPGGGYEFLNHPNKITLLSIIEAIDGKKAYLRCILGFPDCNHQNPCSMHESWVELKARLLKCFKGKTVFHLMNKGARA